MTSEGGYFSVRRQHNLTLKGFRGHLPKQPHFLPGISSFFLFQLHSLFFNPPMVQASSHLSTYIQCSFSFHCLTKLIPTYVSLELSLPPAAFIDLSQVIPPYHRLREPYALPLHSSYHTCNYTESSPV